MSVHPRNWWPPGTIGRRARAPTHCCPCLLEVSPHAGHRRYNAKDRLGNDAKTVTRTVRVVDSIKPEMTLLGNESIEVEGATKYDPPLPLPQPGFASVLS